MGERSPERERFIRRTVAYGFAVFLVGSVCAAIYGWFTAEYPYLPVVSAFIVGGIGYAVFIFACSAASDD